MLDGLFRVIANLFQVTFRQRSDVPLWHADARYYDIIGSNGQAIGGFYLDPYARPNKRSGAWMDDCVGRKELSSGTALPVAYLVCNALPGAAGKDAQLTHDDVVTLFHEFGHGLHHMLTRVKYPSISGINGVAWDAVELPASSWRTTPGSPRCCATSPRMWTPGSGCPRKKSRSCCAHAASRRASPRCGRWSSRCSISACTRNTIRQKAPAIAEILAEVRREVAIIKVPEWNRYANSFGHIFAGGYAAGYYSYKWAEVLSADAFSAFEEAGIYDRGTAQRFVDNILSRGGSRDALDAFVAFRGRKPRIEPLLRQHGIAS